MNFGKLFGGNIMIRLLLIAFSFLLLASCGGNSKMKGMSDFELAQKNSLVYRESLQHQVKQPPVKTFEKNVSGDEKN